jgi:hypothetical protein
VCGGGLIVDAGGKKRGRRPEYICHRHRANGSCSNALRLSVEEMNEAVLVAVEEHALTPEAIEHVITMTERDDVADHQTRLHRESKDVEKRIARLVAAIEAGGEAASLVSKLKELEARRTAIAAEASSLRPVPRLEPSIINNRLACVRATAQAGTVSSATRNESESGTEKLSFSNPITRPARSFMSTTSSPVSSQTYSSDRSVNQTVSVLPCLS